MRITRDVVIDLWPLYHSGEASADTRTLVEDFLRDDPEFARRMRDDRASKLLEPVPLALEPDHEMRTFKRTRQAIYKKDWSLFLALLFTCFAFGRIVSDTSWDVSPRNFAIMATIAGIMWIVFLVRFVRRLAALR